ncbi:hypothetical protein JZ751_012402 [Albula glossodonta]|uniref:ADF-H domain-containing protein n=1 Tax=Albula glossodonta TaxID=121402 RepID=A0A8T2PSI6_9TELE|nr:hypothetical protein JZ751_012402 [Albula glossodonta]
MAAATDLCFCRALFTYEGITNNLKLSDSGVGGVPELAGKLHVKRPLYGLCRVGMDGPAPARIVMINWVGEGVDEYRRKECTSHVPAIKAFFRGFLYTLGPPQPPTQPALQPRCQCQAEVHVFVNASRPEEVTEEKIRAIISKISAPKERVRRGSQPVEKEETVGTNYKRTIAAMEMRRINRDTFWAHAEKEEENRKEEERRRAMEDRRRRERERIQQERREAEERERKMHEKEQMIQEQRRMQAKIEAEARKQERLRWEQQQREHEEEMRARFRHSESIEKAAEAAALVSQRSMNPREFFRQLSSSSSKSPSNPSSPRTVRPPFRRYQRSLTDTAFIFTRSDSSTPTSPRSPTVVSPISRTPTSPFRGSLSPTSPGCADPTTFQPIPLASPPTSPHCPAPNVTLPSLPPSTSLQSPPPQPQAPTSPKDTGFPEALSVVSPPPAPTPSAPPASPGLLASFSQTQPSPHFPPTLLESSSPVEAPAIPLLENLELTSLNEFPQPEENPQALSDQAEPVMPADMGMIPVVEEVEEEEEEVQEEEKKEEVESEAPEEETQPNLQAPETATTTSEEERSPTMDFLLSDPTPSVTDTAVEETAPEFNSSPLEEEHLQQEAEPKEEATAEDGDEKKEDDEEKEVQSAPSQEPNLTGPSEEGAGPEAVCHPYQESEATGEVIQNENESQSTHQESHPMSANGMSNEDRWSKENGVSLEQGGTGSASPLVLLNCMMLILG